MLLYHGYRIWLYEHNIDSISYPNMLHGESLSEHDMAHYCQYNNMELNMLYFWPIT